MAGYSGTPLPKKLGIKEGSRVVLHGAPRGFEQTLGELPDGALIRTRPRRPEIFDVIVLFASTRRALEDRVGELSESLAVAGGLWVAWPKKTSGVATDVTEGAVRVAGLAVGLVDNKVCAIDDTWSAVRFVRRSKDR